MDYTMYLCLKTYRYNAIFLDNIFASILLFDKCARLPEYLCP